MFCNRCGKEIDESTSFCPACGAAAAAGEQERTKNGSATTPGEQPPPGYGRQPQVPPPQQVPPKRSSIPTWVIVLIIAVVLGAIAFPILIAVPVYMNSRSNAQRRTCQSNQRTVDGAIQAYEAMFEEPIYPTSLDDLLRPESMVLKSVPTCPVSDKHYIWVEGTPPSISCPNDSTHTI